jgi:DNA-binding Lrp family transcriptional regulator
LKGNFDEVNEMKISLKRREKQRRMICELLLETPRIYIQDLATEVGMCRQTLRERLREAREQLYIVGPEIRKRSYKNLREYVYFIDCEDSELTYLEMREDQRIIYHAKTIGFCNLWVISREEIDIKGDIIVKGYRSDYHVSYAPNRSWEDAINIMKQKIETFDPTGYTPKKIIKTHLDETIEWDEKDESLYKYFKCDMRKPLGAAMKELGIGKNEVYDFLSKLPQCCTVFTSYFPENLLSYDSYLFMFETDYEDFIIELFSELPTTSSFFKISDKLFAYIHLPKQLIRDTDLEITGNMLYLPPLILDLAQRGIVKAKKYTIVEYFKQRDL